MLFNEPKLLKLYVCILVASFLLGFSALQRAEIAEIALGVQRALAPTRVSVLFNEPKLLKSPAAALFSDRARVSVLFNEPKLLKSTDPLIPAPSPRVSVLFNEPKLLKFRAGRGGAVAGCGFSALQRAEIAEIYKLHRPLRVPARVSVLFNEPKLLKSA